MIPAGTAVSGARPRLNSMALTPVRARESSHA